MHLLFAEAHHAVEEASAEEDDAGEEAGQGEAEDHRYKGDTEKLKLKFIKVTFQISHHSINLPAI